MGPVLVFFGWLGVCALVSWLTAFQMPDGFGNAIFLLQLIGAPVSAGFMAMGLPTAIDPATKIVVSRPGGGPNRSTTWPRKKGVRLTIIGGVIFVAANVGGWVLDRAMGLPKRHVAKVASSARQWTYEVRPALDACLATFWTLEPATCTLRYRVTTSSGAARIDLLKATCPSASIEACVSRHMAGGGFAVEPRQLDSLRFAGPIELELAVSDLRGTGPAPPPERSE